MPTAGVGQKKVFNYILKIYFLLSGSLILSLSLSLIIFLPLRLSLPQTPFTLTLRIWDIYILEGERVLTAMSYTVLKLHKSKTRTVGLCHCDHCFSPLN